MKIYFYILFFLFRLYIKCTSVQGSHLLHDTDGTFSSGQGGHAVGHSLGDTGIKAMVITEDVLHKGDGKAYTSIPALSNALQTGTAKSVDQQIVEMQVGALESEKESLSAKHEASVLKEKLKRLEAKEKRAKADLLAKQKAEIDVILHSPKEELVKDIMPIIAVTPHSLGFVEHDKLELQRLNDLRLAALNEGEMQKRNALLHERPDSESPIDNLASDPSLIQKFYENAPVNKKSAVVDPTKGKFSIINDSSRYTEGWDGHNRTGPSELNDHNALHSNYNTSTDSGKENGAYLDHPDGGHAYSNKSDTQPEIPPSTSETSGLSRLRQLLNSGSRYGSWF